MMTKFKNFEEFEGEIIKYSDYKSNEEYSEYLAKQLNESLGDSAPSGDTIVPKNAWTSEDSKQLSKQMFGVPHPWTRQQYEKFTHPDVKHDISYEDYIKMWKNNTEKENDWGWGTSGRPGEIGRMGAARCGYIVTSSSAPVIKSGEYELEKLSEDIDRLNGYRRPKYPSGYADVNAYVKKNKIDLSPKQKEEDSVSDSWWSKVNIGTRVMIIIMMIGVFLSFLTVVILMLK